MNKKIVVAKTEGHFQGEIYIGPLDVLPAVEMTEAKRERGVIVVGHSETGHHHVIGDAGVKMFETRDPFVCYLVAESYADLVHQRDFDTHATLFMIAENPLALPPLPPLVARDIQVK